MRRHRFALAWMVLLAASHLTTAFWPGNAPAADQRTLELPERGRGARPEHRMRLAYRDLGSLSSRPSVLLLHGAPGSGASVLDLARELARDRRVLAPDLPEFGASSRGLPDASFRAEAESLADFLAAVEPPVAGPVDLVAVSQGGGAAIELAGSHPERVRSLTLFSAIGVQELELLGDYRLNHLLYDVQYGLVWGLHQLVPHFGLLDRQPLDLGYARNFTAADQRPLRGLLGAWGGPTLILHGERDGLVPVAAAHEHARIVPQAELEIVPGGHFLFFQQPGLAATRISAFLAAVDSGAARTRATAPSDRQARSALALDKIRPPRARGVTLLILLSLLALATFLAEDLACLAGGLLVSHGTLAFPEATLACLVGIVVGDLLLVAAGRWLGRPALARAPFKWMVKPATLEASSEWFRREGMKVILISRFIPGSRLPLFFAAGVLHVRLPMLLLAFLLAAVLWTPILVGLSALAGKTLLGLLATYERWALPGIALLLVLLLVLFHLVIPACTWRGRRMLRSKVERLRRWEFWPLWLFQIPVFAQILRLAWRHKSLTVFTAANPAIPAGGFVEESKSGILAGLSASPEALARYARLEPHADLESRLAAARAMMTDLALELPVVLKPDVGERGTGVAVARSHDEIRLHLEENAGPVILQEYVPGEEFGVFYVRRPREAEGRIFSITRKQFPVVRGDGVRTLEELILADQRAVCMARFYLEKNSHRLSEVPASDVPVQLVEIGNHCRGTIFRDGRALATEALRRRIDEISRGFEGFFFGRYDVRVPSTEDFQQGRNLKILELNGVTSEATHIYEPGASLIAAYRTLFEQWRLAFEIGEENAQSGHRPTTLRELLRLLKRRYLD
ncbi:MAG: alpha/beta fold hydrolase [Thermoanaerobaculia bacterium]